MKTRIQTIILICALALPFFAVKASAQQHTVISGVVTDATDKDPIPYVTVLFKGTNIITKTDADGKYSISTS